MQLSLPVKPVFGYLAERLRILPSSERHAVFLTLAAAILGFGFALLDPAIGPWKRIGRIAVDLLLVAGILEHLRRDPREVIRKKAWEGWAWLEKLTRFGFIFGGLLSIGICLWVPNVDFWLKGYRISLSLIILGFGITGTKKIRAGRNAAAALLLTILFELVELGVLAYTTITIEGPIVYAGMHAVSLTTIRHVRDTGFRVDDKIGSLFLQLHLLEPQNNRLRLSPIGNDILHIFRGDPLASFSKTANYELQQPPLIILKNALSQQNEEQHCRFMRGLDVPSGGYATTQIKLFMRQTFQACVEATQDPYWMKKILESDSVVFPISMSNARRRAPSEPSPARIK